jgi:hypothetical protein
MARKTAAPSARTHGSSSHHYLLAGVGAVSLGRKQAIQSYQQAIDGLNGLRGKAESAAREFESKARQLRRQLDARIAPMQKQFVALATEARTQAERRLSPVLSRFGIKPVPAKRAPRKRAVAERTRRAA